LIPGSLEKRGKGERAWDKDWKFTKPAVISLVIHFGIRPIWRINGGLIKLL